MRFRDVARWSLCRTGFLGSERMKRFLKGLLRTSRFEEMRLPLGIVATDLCTGEAVSFRDKGDVFEQRGSNGSVAADRIVGLARHQQILTIGGSRARSRVTYFRGTISASQFGEDHRHDSVFPKAVDFLRGRIRKQRRTVLLRFCHTASQ